MYPKLSLDVCISSTVFIKIQEPSRFIYCALPIHMKVETKIIQYRGRYSLHSGFKLAKQELGFCSVSLKTVIGYPTPLPVTADSSSARLLDKFFWGIPLNMCKVLKSLNSYLTNCTYRSSSTTRTMHNQDLVTELGNPPPRTTY